MKRRLCLLFMLYIEWRNRIRISREVLDPYLRQCGLSEWQNRKERWIYIWNYPKWKKQYKYKSG